MTKVEKIFHENKNKSKEEKKEIYKSLITAEEQVELYRLEKAEKFVSSNAILDSTKIHVSDSGKYKLTITQYETGPKSWKYTLGTVAVVLPNGDTQIITEVQRNYSSFPFVFIEGHSNGHDYLVCGEDYQGQTVIELDTGKKSSYVPVMGGFCWVNMMPSPSGKLIAVDGCYWACGYEIKIFDFSDPLKPPFDCFTEKYTVEEFNGWNADDTCNITVEYETRKSDGKPLSELTEQEEEELEKIFIPGINMDEIYGFEKKEMVWSKP